MIKVKRGNVLYIKIKSSPNEQTVMSIKGVFSNTKIKTAKKQAGGQGLVQYQLIDSTRAEISFEPIRCGG